jgi:hypothetical protein
MIDAGLLITRRSAAGMERQPPKRLIGLRAVMVHLRQATSFFGRVYFPAAIRLTIDAATARRGNTNLCAIVSEGAQLDMMAEAARRTRGPSHGNNAESIFCT